MSPTKEKSRTEKQREEEFWKILKIIMLLMENGWIRGLLLAS